MIHLSRFIIPKRKLEIIQNISIEKLILYHAFDGRILTIVAFNKQIPLLKDLNSSN